MTDVIHIAIPASASYRKYAEVTAASAARLSSLPVVVHYIDESSPLYPRFAELGTWHGSPIAFSRLFLAELFPELDWIISCDADVLFRGDLAELWRRRDDSVSIIASEDHPLPGHRYAEAHIEWYRRHGLDFDDPYGYFCDGLSLCNLKKWRVIGAQVKFVELAQRFRDWPSPDQMIINYVLRNDKRILPREWGVFSGDENLDIDWRRPMAIHFVEDTPWHRGKLTQLESDTVRLWKSEAARIGFVSVSSVFRRMVWLILTWINPILRLFPGIWIHFRNTVRHPSSDPMTSKKKLLWWTRGPNTHHSALLEALRALGVDVEVCYYHGRYGRDRLSLGWKDPELRPWEHYARTITEARRAVADFDERIQMIPGYSERLNWQVISYCRKHGLMWFAMCEGTSGSWKSRFVFRHFAKVANRLAIAVFPLGGIAAEQFRAAGVDPRKIHPFRYAVKTPDAGTVGAKTASAAGPDPLVFVFAGELCERKAVDVIASAWRRIHRDFPSTRLIVAGGRNASRMDLSLLSADGVEYVGAVPQEEIYSVIARGDVMLLPSRYDPWGAALAEGAAAGLAIIGSDRTGSALELIEENVNGFVVKAGDTEALYQAMARYAADPALARRHGEMARCAAESTKGEFLAHEMSDALGLL